MSHLKAGERTPMGGEEVFPVAEIPQQGGQAYTPRRTCSLCSSVKIESDLGHEEKVQTWNWVS